MVAERGEISRLMFDSISIVEYEKRNSIFLHPVYSLSIVIFCLTHAVASALALGKQTAML